MDKQRIKFYPIIFFILNIFLNTIATAGELEDRRVIQKQTIDDLKKHNFKNLEKYANKYRTEPRRTSSGLYPLTFYYLGVTNYSGWSANYPDDIWKQHKSRNEKWIKQYPDSPTPYIVQAILLEQLAYTYRVAGYEKAVTPKDMEKSIKLMQQAYTVLIKNKTIAAKDPHWYNEMLRIATGQRWEEQRYMKLVDEAVNKFPMYLQLYFTAVDYYSPKFGGDIASMEKFARYAVKHTKDKLGMSLYARIYWAAFQSWPKKTVIAQINWDNFKSGLDTVLNSYPDDWNSNNFALFACLFGDRNKAKELIEKINIPNIRNVWGTVDNFNSCKSAAGVNEARGKKVGI